MESQISELRQVLFNHLMQQELTKSRPIKFGIDMPIWIWLAIVSIFVGFISFYVGRFSK